MPTPRVQPFRPTFLGIGLYRIALGPAVDVRYQRELLTQLHTDFPTLRQMPGGALFADEYHGRTLTIDQEKIQADDENTETFTASAEWIEGIFKKALATISFRPPYRVSVQARGEIQALEGTSPTEVLNGHFGPLKPDWFGGGEVLSGVRYVWEGMANDLRIEPLFADPQKFYLSGTFYSPAQGFETLQEAIVFSRSRADDMGKLGDKLIADLLK